MIQSGIAGEYNACMSVEEALLATIAAEPEEDTPRLVYADWLDEHDRHAQAEFIRVQIQVAAVETQPRIILNRHIDLFRRQQTLLDNHREEFLGPFAGLPKNVQCEFHRGFVSELTLNCEQLLTLQPDAFAQRGPLPEIKVTDVGWWLERLDRFPRQLLWVAAIEMQSERRAEASRLGPIGSGERFAFHGPFERLRKLNLRSCRIGDVGLAIVAGSDGTDFFPALTYLDLSWNDLTDLGVETLVQSPLWPRLKELVLGGNLLTDQSAEVLASAAGSSRLVHLNLRSTAIGWQGHTTLLSRFGGKIDFF
ncbi:MAG TPA: TIGR02996 domain-containing protein [Gemmata sp.]|nr:TIGR02996 domain-containing protein [Gemmata sp.]